MRDTSGVGTGLFQMHGVGAHRFGDDGGASRFYPQLKSEDELAAWIERLVSPLDDAGRQA